MDLFSPAIYYFQVGSFFYHLHAQKTKMNAKHPENAGW